ncbi:acetolactate synthase-1/2/3 large subunit [Tranquillimonas alkanivorans]|uniref:Acetolactate synthase-1/2/3 large subunit n=1 Tax=Tranquillimonas alkanivorans TaxID=441119 RepID=A0A1I5PK41_9RHOB|nr:acetolactate synthase-1/2/3 large subunit [Tranquillimonas alkanivorans]
MALRHGGLILAEALRAHGVERVFSVPGESFLAALDGLHELGIGNVVCRQEGGAAMMAEATAKMTGTPGVVFVTRGPGATNASSGLHVAMQDSTPMVCFVGQIARGHRDREAFQEVDYRAFFGPLVKWVAEVDQTERLPEYVMRAFHVAQSGRPGPVVLALPEDMLSAQADVPDLAPTAPAVSRATPEQIVKIVENVSRAKHPLVVAGGPGWSQEAADALKTFAEAAKLPVAVSFRRQDRMDNRSPSYVGDLGVGANPALAKRLRDADLVLALGTRLGDIVTGGYEHLDPAQPGKTILHVHPDADEIGRVFRSDLAVVAQAADVVAALAADPPAPGDWAAWTEAARADYEAWQTPKETPGAVKMERVVGWLAANLPDDAIVTNGAGNYAAWLHRYYSFRRFGTQLAPTSGSMGYGFPAAVAASIAHPDRTVVCLAGDGCFQMTLNEASTAMQHGAKPVVIVCNNGRYGTIRMHQERQYPGRVSGTDLANPDFGALARAYGGYGEVVEDGEAFPQAFARARASGTLAVIELRLDPEALSPGATLSEVRGG